MTPNDPMYSGATFVGTAGQFEYEELLSDGLNVTSIVCPFDFAGHPPVPPQLKRGTVMHFVPAATGNLCWLPAAAAECNAVLAMDVDVSIAPTPPAQLYLTGKMKANALVYVAGINPPLAVDALRLVGIYVESVLNRQGSYTRAPGTTLPQSLGLAADPAQAHFERLAKERGETVPPDGPERVAWLETHKHQARERGEFFPVDPSAPPKPVDAHAPKHERAPEHGHKEQHPHAPEHKEHK
jgi:hypothetical protein